MKPILIIIALTALSHPAQAERLCNTKIGVISGNNPALSAVTVTIKRGKKTIVTRTRHSFDIKLPCGVTHKAIAKAGKKTATRNFNPGMQVTLPLI